MRPKRQKVVLAFVGSLLLHGVALLLFALVVALHPPAPPPTPPPDEPVQLEVVQEEPTPTPPPLPDASATPTPTPKRKLVVEASGEDSNVTPSPDAVLADRTTRASSAETGDNSRPGAAQAGRKMTTFQFDPAPPAPGIVSRAEAVAPTPLPQTAPALPQPERFTQQTPPPSQPASTPPPATPVPTAAPDEFAMAMATPTPPLLPEDPFDPSIRSTSPPLPKPAAKRTPTPPVAANRSAENGGGVPRGPGGVETLATPAGRYARQVTTMITFIWHRSMESRQDLSYGAVVIHCSIDKDGLVIGPRVASNTSDPVFASTALQAVVVSRLPAMPPDVVAELEGKRLPMDITFDYTPLPQDAAQR